MCHHLPKFLDRIPFNTAVYTDEILTLLATAIIIPVARAFIGIQDYTKLYTYQSKTVVGSHLHCEANNDHGCHCWGYHLLKTVVLGLWSILISIQLVKMTDLSLGVLLLAHPQVTIILIMFLYSTLVCFFYCSILFCRNFQDFSPKMAQLFKYLVYLPKFRHFDQIFKKHGCLNLGSHYL